MNSVIVENDRYTVDPLYQWDKNQVLEIRGLSLPSIPEIHFTNDAMERSIVRQSTINSAGIITVMIPNSLLQKPYTVKAYICIYEGDTFKTLYSINIPVKARKMPTDYTIENDEEIYSFNALENLVYNTEAKYDALASKYENIDSEIDGMMSTVAEANKNYNNILTAIPNKADKSIVVGATLSASGWSGNTYSFEGTYPVATYDIEIALNSTATVDQAEAFNSAQIVGNATSNIVKAFGNVPTIDIPIIIKAVKR